MANCAKCGNPLNEGQPFCSKCGQPTGLSAGAPSRGAGMPPAAGAQYGAGQPYGGGQAYAPGQQRGAAPGYNPDNWAIPPKKKRAGLWIALAALALIIVIACVLVFVVFHDDIFGGGQSTPEGAVTKFFKAVENEDIDGVFEVMDQQMFTETFGEAFLDAAKDAMEQEMFGEGSVEFDDLQMITDETSDTTATVTVIGGTFTATDADGETYTGDVDEMGLDSFDLVEKDGSWYLDPSALDW